MSEADDAAFVEAISGRIKKRKKRIDARLPAAVSPPPPRARTMSVASMNVTTLEDSNTTAVAISGENFRGATTVYLRRTGQTAIQATSLTVPNPGKILCSFVVPDGTDAGPWDLEVNSAGQKSTLSAYVTISTITLTSISPTSHDNSDESFEVTFTGTNYTGTTTAKFTKSGESDIECTNVVVVNATTITADVNFNGAATGTWTASVTSNGDTATLADAMTISEAFIDDFEDGSIDANWVLDRSTNEENITLSEADGLFTWTAGGVAASDESRRRDDYALSLGDNRIFEVEFQNPTLNANSESIFEFRTPSGQTNSLVRMECLGVAGTSYTIRLAKVINGGSYTVVSDLTGQTATTIRFRLRWNSDGTFDAWYQRVGTDSDFVLYGDDVAYGHSATHYPMITGVQNNFSGKMFDVEYIKIAA